MNETKRQAFERELNALIAKYGATLDADDRGYAGFRLPDERAVAVDVEPPSPAGVRLAGHRPLLESCVTQAWAAFLKRCEEADVTPDTFPRMILYRDGSGYVENTWVGPGRRTRHKLGTLFEGMLFREDENRPEIWVRKGPRG